MLKRMRQSSREVAKVKPEPCPAQQSKKVRSRPRIEKRETLNPQASHDLLRLQRR
jgi:hypothetical protein